MKMDCGVQVVVPLADERPTHCADRIGRLYAERVGAAYRKKMGQYLTQPSIADLMAGFAEPVGSSISVLDPGAGTGVLACALCERLAFEAAGSIRIHVDAYEVDPGLAELLNGVLLYLRTYLQERGHDLTFSVRVEDFVLRNSDRLRSPTGLLSEIGCAAEYDLVISNPPYFKICKADPRAAAAATVVHGQPNIYALFMAVSACLLRPGGQLIFITPRSYASGPYFRVFREMFFSKVRPRLLHVFDSRTDAFERDSVLQENVITVARRDDGWFRRPAAVNVTISISNGTGDLDHRRERSVPVSSVLDFGTRDKVLAMPTDDYADAVKAVVHSWTGSLESYGLQISTGPVVPFRASAELLQAPASESWAPLLWMQNVRAMRVEWPVKARRKHQYIRVGPRPDMLLVPNKNYVLMRRFSSKEEHRRLVAAPLLREEIPSHWLGIENHLNYVYRVGGELTPEEVWGLAVLFNSDLLDIYFRCMNGNTQVSATELRAIPLPPLKTLAQVGRAAREAADPTREIGSLVLRMLSGVSFFSLEGARIG